MRRRDLLEVGLSLATLPIGACGGAEPPPRETGRATLRAVTAAPPTSASAVEPAPQPTESAAPPSGATPAASAVPVATNTGPGLDRVVARVGQNHGHVFLVSMDDVRAGVSRTYNLTGTSPHAHTATLGPEEFAKLAAGEIVRTSSTRTGHAHRLLVKLAPAVDPPDTVNVCETGVAGKDDHELIVTSLDIAAGVAKTFDVQGISDHNHKVEISAEDFAKLSNGDQLLLATGLAIPGADHGHRVYVRYRKSR